MFTIEDVHSTGQAEVKWPAPDQRTRGAWNNQIDTTEMGACACVIAGIELSRDHRAVRRAETATGADYYVGPPGAGVDDLEDCYRLEVSGVSAGDAKAVRLRVLQKVAQAAKGKDDLPAAAGVVGFAARLIVIANV